MSDSTASDLWSDDRLDAIVEWVESAYPEEGCGLVLRDASTGEYRVLECENLADKYHEMDPEQYPRTAREFYVVDPMEFMRAEDRGESVEVVFHSHADHEDYFSDEDVAAATMERESDDEAWEASHPGVDYLVVSVREGEARHGTLYRFDGEGDHPFHPVLEIGVDEAGYTLERS